MKLIIHPSSISGEVTAPPSKSFTHRALFLGLLSDGETRLYDPLISRDTLASMRAIKKFGAKGGWDAIIGRGEVYEPDSIIHCSRSATTIRFSTAVASLVKGLTILTGDRSLRRRPMTPILSALKQLGIKVYSRGGYAPIVVVGSDKLSARVRINGEVSSQFISGLLLAAPFIGLEINVEGRCRSRPYIDITIELMKTFGVSVEREEYSYFRVEKSTYKATKVDIPGDYSLAAALLVAGALYGYIRVRRLSSKSIQGDSLIIDILKEAGAHIYVGNDYIEVKKAGLNGVSVDCGDIPDLFPLISVLGAYAEGKTIVTGGGHLRYKESDRIRNMAINLGKMGVKLKERPDGLIIYGGRKLRGAVLNPHYDHRIAIALAIASIGAGEKSTILHPGCIADSYPSFISDLSRLGCRLEVIK
jgi:3-phosphoshikimate 1-carboxyvinyltransferase